MVDVQELHAGAAGGDLSRDVLVRDEVVISATAGLNNRVSGAGTQFTCLYINNDVYFISTVLRQS